MTTYIKYASEFLTHSRLSIIDKINVVLYSREHMICYTKPGCLRGSYEVLYKEMHFS